MLWRLPMRTPPFSILISQCPLPSTIYTHTHIYMYSIGSGRRWTLYTKPKFYLIMHTKWDSLWLLTKGCCMRPGTCFGADNACLAHQQMPFVATESNQWPHSVFSMAYRTAGTIDASINRCCWLAALNCCKIDEFSFLKSDLQKDFSQVAKWKEHKHRHRGTLPLQIPFVSQSNVAGPFKR